MIPELGHLALILALCLALAQAGFGLAGAHWRRADWMGVVRPAVAGQFVFLALAFGCLVTAFIQHDFSVAYVAQNSNSALPTYYRVAAVWGAHEGSLLLWIVVLAIWSLAVAAFSRALPTQFLSRVLGVLGLVSAGFMSFTLATSNPFLRLQPAVVEGNDLNPLLQDFALTVHPPILYTGYVGFAVAFAFACAAMLEGRLDQSWARWTRPWTTVAWLFLTVGISLGSWWAYYELGWGGWCSRSSRSRSACSGPSSCARACWCPCTPLLPIRRAACSSWLFSPCVSAEPWLSTRGARRSSPRQPGSSCGRGNPSCSSTTCCW
jgi:cytochrome c-type biogenesis protein CcmF